MCEIEGLQIMPGPKQNAARNLSATPVLAADESGSSDRRKFPRSRSIYRPAVLNLEDFATFCMIRDLSPHGVMAETSAKLHLGDIVEVGFAEDELATGTVAWVNGSRIGVAFDRPVDIVQLMTGSASQDIFAPVPVRAPRLTVTCDAVITDGPIISRLPVRNLSIKGLKLRGTGLRVGTEVSVEIEHLPKKIAVVRWLGRQETGIEFLIPFTYEEIAAWTRQNRSAPLETKLTPDERSPAKDGGRLKSIRASSGF